MRHGKPCWYKVDDVKWIATNDILCFENGCYQLLKRHFNHLPCYVNMVELMHESELSACIGQSLDSQMSNNDVTQFTLKKYRCLTDYKTSLFTVYMPLALSMMLTG